jgi:hypothetical protein
MIKVARKIITARSEICMKVRFFASTPNPSKGPKKLKNAFILKILSAKNSLASVVDWRGAKWTPEVAGEPFYL